MTKTYLLIAMSAIGCCFFSCSSNKQQEPSTKNAESSVLDKQWAKSFIDSMNAKFSVEIAAGDSAALASHYWPDAELLLDNSEVVKGDQMLSSWGGAIRSGMKGMKFTTTDITGTPTFIIETGNYEMSGEKNAMIDRGKYVVIWEKRNGEWRLYRDIGCTSLPAPK